tara:strand:- start:92 stop:325 length:234 start_codon:yes stop_codon:yes gene_type:complete
MIHNRHKPRPKGWFEEWLDLTFPEKLITIIWCTMPYFFFIMADGLEIWYKIAISVGGFILATLLCYWFGKVMSELDY